MRIRRTLGVASLLPSIVVLAMAGPVHAVSLDLGVTTDSTCIAASTFNGAGSLKNWAQCGSVFGTALANSQAFSVGNTGTASSLSVDAAATADAGNSNGNRGHIRHQLGFVLTLTIDVEPGDEWMLEFDQQARGLLAALEEASGEGSGRADILFDINQSISVGLGSGDYDLQFGTGTLSRKLSDSLEVFDQRTDVITGTGDTVLSGFVRTQIGAYSQCLNTVNGACVNGDEAAMLFGLDGIAGAGLGADDYATWGRTVADDGYDASFTLSIVPEPATGTMLSLGLLGLVMHRRRDGRNVTPK